MISNVNIVNRPVNFSIENRKVLTPEHIHALKGNKTNNISINCETFFRFVHYAMNDVNTYNSMVKDLSFKPWRILENNLKYNIPDENDIKINQMYAHYDLHHTLLLENPIVKVKPTATMGLGLFAVNDNTKYSNLSHCYGKDLDLFGYVEWLDDEAFNWFNDRKFPSLYTDYEGHKGILYGPLYFCNHQPWGPTFEAINETTFRSRQVTITTTTSKYDCYSEVAPLIIDNPCILSQNINNEKQTKEEEETNFYLVTTKESSYYIVVLKFEDPDEEIKLPYNSLNSSYLSAVDNEFYIEIFVNYGDGYE